MARILCALGGAGMMALLTLAFDRIPASWLCDYDEEPDESRLSAHRISMPARIALILLGAFLAALLEMRFGFGTHFAFCLLGAGILLLSALSDAKYTIIPDQFCLALGVMGLLAAGISSFSEGSFAPLLYALLGAALGGGAIWLVGILGALITRREAMGMGDCKLLFAIGLFLGFPSILYCYLVLILFAGLTFSVLMLLRTVKSGEYRPLGPYIAASAILTLLMEPMIEKLVQWYLSMIRF